MPSQGQRGMNTLISPEQQSKSFEIPAGVYAQQVVSVGHYTERLFKFRITRPASFRFRSGEFVMIGLPNAERPIFRAYSIASPSWDDELEFFSIKVPDGPLTQHLQRIRPGDTILMRRKPTGTLVNDALLPAKRLYLLSTGTGIAPFASIIRDPETYEKFESIIMTHTCRLLPELDYGRELAELTRQDEIVGEDAQRRLFHFPTTTRDESSQMGRITDLIRSGQFPKALGFPAISPDDDRVMICGSMAFLAEVRGLMEGLGFTEGSNSAPAQFVVERAFVG